MTRADFSEAVQAMRFAARVSLQSADPVAQNGAVIVVGNRWYGDWNRAIDPRIEDAGALGVLPGVCQVEQIAEAPVAVIAACARSLVRIPGSNLYSVWGVSVWAAQLMVLCGINRAMFWRPAIDRIPSECRREYMRGVSLLRSSGVNVHFYRGPILDKDKASVGVIRFWGESLSFGVGE